LKRLAVFASGRGSNFKAILDQINSGFIPATVGLCVTNNPKAGVIEIAESNRIPVKIFPPKDYSDANDFNEAILRALILAEIDFIILAGYLKMIGRQIVDKYNNKIINIHPALLPSFGGKGMYGHHVHDAVYNRGTKLSGATVHLVNKEYDAGPIVLQESVAIGDAKSSEEIAKRVLKIEHEIFPLAVKLLVEDRLKVNGLRVDIVGEQVIGHD
jgi:formyltetrahydrofolate-dependent phosphoribosylglycinamide formyltransferase